jgi:hypothetical protein
VKWRVDTDDEWVDVDADIVSVGEDGTLWLYRREHTGGPASGYIQQIQALFAKGRWNNVVKRDEERSE